MNHELLPCPFCGDDAEKGRQAVTQMNSEKTSFVRILCRCCGAMAPELNWQERYTQPVQPAKGCASDVADSSEFIQRTNAEYSEWCKTYYQADALDDRGMVSLHGLWAWQEQARRKICAPIAQPIQPPSWDGAQRVCDLPGVDEAIRNFIEDNTGDNATFLVLEIMNSTQTVPTE